MHVVDHDQQRPVGALLLEEPTERPQLFLVHPGGVDRLQRVVHLARERPDPGGHVGVGDGTQLADDVGGHPGPAQGAVGGVGRADDGAVRFGHPGQLGDQPGLARSGVAAHHDDLGLAVTTDPPPLGLEEGQLVVAAHQRRCRRAGLEVDGLQRHRLPHLDRLLLAFEQDGLAGPERDPPSGQLGGETTAQHLARARPPSPGGPPR